jgi:predicted transcriptional regulator
MTRWELVSFVKASEMRLNILQSLYEKVHTPTELKQKFSVPISRISSILKELSNKGLVENLTPERRKSKMFSITKKGKEIISEINKLTEGGE